MKILFFPGLWNIDIMEIMRTNYEKNLLIDKGFAAPQYKEGIFLFVCFSPWRKLGYLEQMFSKSAEEAIRCFKNAVKFLGKYDALPRKIICDEGKEFSNEKFKDYILKCTDRKLYVIPRQYYTHNNLSHLDNFIKYIRIVLSKPMDLKEYNYYYKQLKDSYTSVDGLSLNDYIKTTIGGFFVCRLSDFNETYNENTIIKEYNASPAKITNLQMYLKLLESVKKNKESYGKIKQANLKIGSLVHMKFLKNFSSKTNIKYTLKPYKIIGRVGNRFILKNDDPKDSTIFFRMLYDVKPYQAIESVRDDIDENHLEASNYYLYNSKVKNKNDKYTVTLSNGEIKKNISESQFFEHYKNIVKLNLKGL